MRLSKEIEFLTLYYNESLEEVFQIFVSCSISRKYFLILYSTCLNKNSVSKIQIFFFKLNLTSRLTLIHQNQ
jgi:hypothetical protein